MIQFPNQGLQHVLEYIVNKRAPGDLDVRLFTNNVAAGTGLTEADFVEAAFVGYAPVLLVAADWNFIAGDPSQISHADIQFKSQQEQGVEYQYGYYLTRRDTGKLVYYEKFIDGPYPMRHVNDNVTFPPTIKMRNLGA